MDNTLQAVLEFTEQLTAKGIYNQNTGGARAAALRKFMEVVPGLASKDVHEVVVEDIVRQYANLKPGDKWLNNYAARIKSAIRYYNEYKNDPGNFRPKIKQSMKLNTRKPKEIRNAEVPLQETGNKSEAILAGVLDFKNSKTHSTIRLHLRPDTEVAISGIPLDFTATECKQLQALLGAFVKTAFEE